MTVRVYDTPFGKGMCGMCAEDVGPCEGPPCVNAQRIGEPDVEFLSDVAREVARARLKFPSSNLVLAAATEELGELAQAMLHARAGKGPKEHVWEEAVQLAAMALRCAVEGDPSFDAVPYTEPETS